MADLQPPVNIQEQYLYGINQRLEALINMMSSFIEVYADKNKIAITNNTVIKKPPKRKG